MNAVRLRAELSLVSIAFIWGATFVVVKDALHDVSTLLFLALRFSFATLLLLVVFRRRLSAEPDRRSLLGGILCGAFLFIGYALQTAGLRYTTASNSAFITGLYVVLVPMLGALIARAMPRGVELTAAAAAMTGIGLMTWTDASAQLNPGDLMTAGSAVAFAAHIVAVAHWSHRMNYEWLTVLQVAMVGAFSLASFGWAEVPYISWTPRLVSALLITSALATALSFSLYTKAQRHTSAARAALIFALEPVFAGLVAWIFAGEQWTAISLCGAALVLFGILLVEMKPERRRETSPTTNPQ